MSVRDSSISLIDAVLDIVENHPELHDQSLWVDGLREALEGGTEPDCGTTACVAGWAAILSAPAGSRIESTGHVLLAGEDISRDVEEYAVEALGISESGGVWLFSQLRTRDEITVSLRYLKAYPEAGYDELDGACFRANRPSR
jgi:hypothetical protein